MKTIKVQYKRNDEGQVYSIEFDREDNSSHWTWNGVVPSMFAVNVDKDETIGEEYLTDEEYATWQPKL